MTLFHVAALIFFIVAILESHGKSWIAWGLASWLLATTGIPRGIPTTWVILALVILLIVVMLSDPRLKVPPKAPPSS